MFSHTPFAAARVAPLVYYLLCLYNIVEYFRSVRRRAARNDFGIPAVSILKPVRVMHPGAYENFASHCCLNYPRYEVIFAVTDPRDRIVPIIEKLQRNFPEQDIRQVTSVERLEQNHK